jgi:hypothetical protein
MRLHSAGMTGTSSVMTALVSYPSAYAHSPITRRPKGAHQQWRRPTQGLSIAQFRAQVILMSRQCPAAPVAGGPLFESHTTSPRVSPYMVWLCPAATVNVFVPLDVAIVNPHFGLVPMGQEKTALQSRPGKFASAKAPVTGKHPVNNASEIVTTYPLRHETACTTSSTTLRVQTSSRKLWLDRDGRRPRHANQTTRRSNGF